VLGLTGGDYLLWNWSLSGSHDVTALVSGLTLPPLVAASTLLLAITVLRLLARSARRSGPAQRTVEPEPEITVQRVSPRLGDHDAPGRVPNDTEWSAPVASDEGTQRRAAAGNQRRPSRKLAA
jgi:hypothetical protein